MEPGALDHRPSHQPGDTTALLYGPGATDPGFRGLFRLAPAVTGCGWSAGYADGLSADREVAYAPPLWTTRTVFLLLPTMQADRARPAIFPTG